MNLKDLRFFLEEQPRDKICKYGFNNPHSYRGYYDEVAFEPASDVSIQSMLDCVDDALTEEFEGWKGGIYEYDLSTNVHIAYKGICSYEEDEGIPLEIFHSIVNDYTINEIGEEKIEISEEYSDVMTLSDIFQLIKEIDEKEISKALIQELVLRAYAEGRKKWL